MEDPEEAQELREDVQRQLVKARRAIVQLEQSMTDLKRYREDPQNRIIGHVVLSPPLVLNAGKDGFVQDFAVVEVDTTKIDATNFIGNAIDLGTEIPATTVTFWMDTSSISEPSFKYPHHCIFQLSSLLSRNEIHTSPNTVLKRTSSSALTVGRLNNICSLVRKAFDTKPTELSGETFVLPRNSQVWRIL